MPKKSKHPSADEPSLWAPYTAGQGFAYAYKVDGFSEVYPLLWAGKPLPKPYPRMTLDQLDSEKVPDVLGVPLMVIIAAPWIRDLLDEMGRAQIQYVPVRFKGSRSTDYQLVHVLERVSCLDRAKSKLAKFEDGDDEYVKKLRLLPLDKQGPNVFRIAELPRLIVVTPELRKALQEVSNSPGVFQSLDELREG